MSLHPISEKFRVQLQSYFGWIRGAVPATDSLGTAEAESVVTKSRFTLDEFRSIAIGLPQDREITRRFENGYGDTLTYADLFEQCSSMPLDYAIYDTRVSHALVACRITAGWLCMEYASSKLCMQDDLARHERAAFGEPAVRQLVGMSHLLLKLLMVSLVKI